MARQQRLPGVDWHKGDIRAESSLAKGAKEYSRSQGLRGPSDVSAVRADPNVLHTIGGIIGRQQGAPAHISEQLTASYAALHEHIGKQYEHITKPTSEGGLGIHHEITSEDPYSGIGEAMDDVRKNRRLRTLATDTTQSAVEQNPLMPADINDKFRFVHDVFGHLATGRDFTRHGEEAAAQAHAATLPREAHAALFSETRGQNSALIRSGSFPEQRGYEMPDWATKAKPKLPTPKRRKAEPAPTLF